MTESLHGQREAWELYPCSQLLTLLLLADEVLGGHLQLKLSQLMLPAHCSKDTSTTVVSFRHQRSPALSWYRVKACGVKSCSYLRASE